MKKYAPVILRIGISLVFLWFGYHQLAATDMWTSLIPAWATRLSGMSASTLVLINGSFEVIFGICLLLGVFTRIVAFLLALHMVHIALTVGYNAIGIRDFGLSIAAISIFLYGVDVWCLDKVWAKSRYAEIQ